MLNINVDSLKALYEERIDFLIENLGRNIQLIFEDTITSVPSVGDFDGVRGGSIRPSFKETIETTPNTSVIKSLVQWNPQNLSEFGINVQKGTTVIRLKTYMRHVPDLKRCKVIIPDFDVKDNIGARFRLIRDPKPQGFGESIYSISFWEQI